MQDFCSMSANMTFDEICEALLKIDPSIRYVGIINENKVVFRKRAGMYSLLNTSENIKSATHALMRWQSRRIFVKQFGMPLYAMAEYPLVKRVTMQLKGNALLLVSMDKDAHHDKIIKKLLKTKEKMIAEKSEMKPLE